MKLAFFLFLTAITPAFSAQTFETGHVVETVAVQTDAKQSYALYLPSGYTEQKRWPVLYCYDARGRGKIAADLFHNAAEKYGYIIASSNNTRSDDPTWPNLEIMKSLWRDTHARFSIDDRRVYLSGFSGGARMAWGVGFLLKGAVTGVIGCGAGNHIEYPPVKDLPFDYFATAGDHDFNYDEIIELGKKLDELGAPSRVESFHGTHEWPPENLATEAVAWMTLRAIKEGKAEKNAAWIDEFYTEQIKQADAAETAGKAYQAAILYKAVERDFADLHDVSAAAAKRQALQNSESFRTEEKRLGEQLRAYHEYNGTISRMIGEMQSESLPSVGKVVQDLQIEHLKKTANKSNGEESLAADRLLQSAFVQLSYYLPEDFIKKNNFRGALLSLSAAKEIRENEPNVYYNFASVYARKGDKKAAIEQLNKAIALGFKNFSYLTQDPDFTNLRQEEAFKKIIQAHESPSL